MVNIPTIEIPEVPTGPLIKEPLAMPDIAPHGATMLPETPAIVEEQKAAFLPPGVEKEAAIKALQQFASDSANNPEQRRTAEDALSGLNAEIANSSADSADRPHRIKESLGKLMKVFKIMGAAIIALLSMGMFKAMKSDK